MKRIKLSKIAMVVAASITLLVGCGGNTAGQTPSATVQLKEGVTLASVVQKIDDEIGISMPADIDEAALRDVFYVEPADVEGFAGKFAMVMTSADNVVAVQAKAGKADAVKAALEHRLEDVKKSFELYLPEQYDKASKGVVMTKGDFVFLLVIGAPEGNMDEDIARAKQIVEESFS